MDGYKKLMTSVLTQAITDYIQAVKVGGIKFSKKLKKEVFDLNMDDILQGIRLTRSNKESHNITAMTRGNKAKEYIFDTSEDSTDYVFEFKFICTYLGIDPEKFRKRIKEKREKFWKDVYARIREM